jgi:hypothetical protein
LGRWRDAYADGVWRNAVCGEIGVQRDANRAAVGFAVPQGHKFAACSRVGFVVPVSLQCML